MASSEAFKDGYENLLKVHSFFYQIPQLVSPKTYYFLFLRLEIEISNLVLLLDIDYILLSSHLNKI